MTVPVVPVFENLVLGDIVAKVDLVLTRDDLVRYAGASGDMNPIHFNDAIATAAGYREFWRTECSLPELLCRPSSTGLVTRAV
ncbi:MaoC like domain-containing protein [Rhodococcus erythropolis]|nr:MaoC like domain-containing protein [Rhodococcus erythropolis]